MQSDWPQIANPPPSSHGSILRTHNFLDALRLSDRMQIKVPVLPSNHTG